ncbi:MAG: Chromate transport protein ChrA, partial [uncultured Sphingomonas sp.]
DRSSHPPRGKRHLGAGSAALVRRAGSPDCADAPGGGGRAAMARRAALPPRAELLHPAAWTGGAAAGDLHRLADARRSRRAGGRAAVHPPRRSRDYGAELGLRPVRERRGGRSGTVRAQGRSAGDRRAGVGADRTAHPARRLAKAASPYRVPAAVLCQCPLPAGRAWRRADGLVAASFGQPRPGRRSADRLARDGPAGRPVATDLASAGRIDRLPCPLAISGHRGLLLGRCPGDLRRSVRGAGFRRAAGGGAVRLVAPRRDAGWFGSGGDHSRAADHGAAVCRLSRCLPRAWHSPSVVGGHAGRPARHLRHLRALLPVDLRRRSACRAAARLTPADRRSVRDHRGGRRSDRQPGPVARHAHAVRRGGAGRHGRVAGPGQPERLGRGAGPARRPCPVPLQAWRRMDHPSGRRCRRRPLPRGFRLGL